MTTTQIQLPAGLTAARIREIARHHGATHVRLFGSRARGEGHADSDLDLLVDLEPGRDLFDLIALKEDLEVASGIAVQVFTEGFLSPHFKDEVLRTAVAL